MHLQPVGKETLLRSSVTVTVATLAGHLIPLVPFMVATDTPARSMAGPLVGRNPTPIAAATRRLAARPHECLALLGVATEN